MRQLIVVTVILLTVQVIKAAIIQTPAADCGCDEYANASPDVIKSRMKECFLDKESMSKANAALQLQNNQYKCSLDEANMKIIKLESENKHLKLDWTKAQDSLKAQQKANADLQKLLDDSSKKLKEANAELANCKASLSSSQQKNSDLEQKNQKLAKENKILSDKIEHDARDCASQKQALQSNIELLTCNWNEEKSESSRIEEEWNRLKESSAADSEKMEEMRLEIDRQSCEIIRINDEITNDLAHDKFNKKLMDDMNLQLASCEAKLRDSEASNAELQAQLQCLKDDSANREEALKQNIRELEEKQRIREKDCICAMKTLHGENDELRNIIENQKGDIQCLQNQLSQKQKELENCEEQLKECRKNIKFLEDKITQLECDNENKKNQIIELECSYKDILEKLEDCEERERIWESKLKDFQEQLNTAERDIESLNREIARLGEEKKKCDCYLAALRCDTDKFTHNMEDDSESLRKDINNLSDKSRSMSAIISAFRQDKSHQLGCSGLDCGCEN